MIGSLVVLSSLLAVSLAAVVTVTIGAAALPERLIVAPFDTLHFVNIDDTRVHRISARDLAGFDSRTEEKTIIFFSFFFFFLILCVFVVASGDLYPSSFPSDKALPRDFVYHLNGAAEGEYLYFDEYTRTLRGSIVVVAYDNPWDTHPGSPGPSGPTRIVAARVPASRANPLLNSITPASVTRVVVEVHLVGRGPATLSAKLRAPGGSAVGPRCDESGAAAAPRDVDGSVRRVESFEIDASSLPDGALAFELVLNGETYIVPGPVQKEANVAAPVGEAKTIINIQL